MLAVTRVGDKHQGHASPTPNPFHTTSYVVGSPNVYVNSKKAVRQGDTTGCGDAAVGKSSTVKINGKGVHRVGDSTSGHGSWVPNASAQGSGNVNAGG